MAQSQILVKNMETKKDIRARILQKRRQMSLEDWQRKTADIFEKLISNPLFLQADEIYCYMDYRFEVGTRQLIEKAWELQKKVAVPKVQGTEMEFYYIDSFAQLQKGYAGILEPVTDRRAQGDSVLVILPGSVFDRKRNRIGYGKGFYDRYLRRHEHHRTIALAFDIQIVDAVPADSHDIRPEEIITEEHHYV